MCISRHLLRRAAVAAALVLAPAPGWAQGRVRLAIRPASGDVFRFRTTNRTRTEVQTPPNADAHTREAAQMLGLLFGAGAQDDFAAEASWRCEDVGADGTVRFVPRLEQLDANLSMMGIAEIHVHIDDSVRVAIRTIDPRLAKDTSGLGEFVEEWKAVFAPLVHLSIPGRAAPDGSRVLDPGDDTVITKLARLGHPELLAMLEFAEGFRGTSPHTVVPGLVVPYPASPLAVGSTWTVNDTIRAANDTAVILTTAVTMQLDSVTADMAWLAGQSSTHGDMIHAMLAREGGERPDDAADAAQFRALFGDLTVVSDGRIDAAVSLSDGMPYAVTLSQTTTMEMGQGLTVLEYATQQVVRISGPAPRQAAMR